MRLHFIAAIIATALLGACQKQAEPVETTAENPALATPQVPTETPAQQRIAADVRQLASDAMEGRMAGTSGYDRAAEYVATQMAAAGLKPAGDNGTWFQQVQLLRATRLRDGSRFTIRHGQRTQALRFEEQFLPQPNFQTMDAHIEGPAVFVRQAINAPTLGHDDFAGINLRGKIAVFFGGAPTAFSAPAQAHYGRLQTKLQAVAERGAIGAVIVNSGADEASAPWADAARNWQRPQMRLRNANGQALDSFPQLHVIARVAATAGDFLFEGTDYSAAQLYQAMQAGSQASFALPIRINLAAKTRVETVPSRNVLGVLPAANATADTVVHSAHLDHLGKRGDTIYYGAMDNALGVAIMLESARTLAAAAPLQQNQLFAALTAEEHGLLGAHWLVRNPPKHLRFIANLNIDMPLLLAPSTDAVALGAEHSTLGQMAQQAASRIGLQLSPDPFPEETGFVRSDQYAFVQAGIPALYLDAGVISADGARKPDLAQRNFMRQHYHKPSDDASLPIYWPDAERMARFSAGISEQISTSTSPPQWHPDDLFGTLFGNKH